METRYDRQMIMEEIGEEGQNKLKNSRVVVCGAGGLGSPVLTYLVHAGIGTITVIDQDYVSISNLNRQFLFREDQIGQSKAQAACEVLSLHNPEVRIRACQEKVTEKNSRTFLENTDLVIDCVDNIETRLLWNDVCLEKGVSLVEGGVEGFYGFAAVIRRGRACLRCMGFRETERTYCAPVLGTTAGVIGSIQAAEGIKLLLGMEDSLENRLLLYDGKEQQIQKIAVKRGESCLCRGLEKGKGEN